LSALIAAMLTSLVIDADRLLREAGAR
jgi:hypothetical protein